MSCYTGVRVLVLGAGGFIGRWVARALSERGADVHAVVRNAAVRVPGHVSVLDLSDPALPGRTVREIRPAITFNLAGYGVDRGERAEQSFYALNVQLVRNLCASVATQRSAGWSGMQLIHVGSI